MRVVIQRVSEASVAVEGREISRIGRGFLVLVGFTKGDTIENLEWMARKIASLRLFEDDDHRMNLNLEAIGGEVLVVSQFTLYADVRKGTRPSFDRSAPADEAQKLYDRFVKIMEDTAPNAVKTGVFQAHMEVSLVNDGPVTITIQKETA